MQRRVTVKVNEFQCSPCLLSHSVDVICKSCDILPSRQGCIMLEVLWCCWISGGFCKIYCANICRTPLAYSSVSYIHRGTSELWWRKFQNVWSLRGELWLCARPGAAILF